MIALATVKSFIRMYWIAFLYQFQDYYPERQLEAVRKWHARHTHLWYDDRRGFFISELHFSGKIKIRFLETTPEHYAKLLKFTDDTILTDNFIHFYDCYLLKCFDVNIPLNKIIHEHLQSNFHDYNVKISFKEKYFVKQFIPYWKGYRSSFYELKDKLP